MQEVPVNQDAVAPPRRPSERDEHYKSPYREAMSVDREAAEDAADSLLDDDAALVARQERDFTKDDADELMERATATVTPEQAGRIMMVQLDPLLRKLPYEQRTALLLNLLVTYAAEQPAALQARGRFINAMCEEFRKRLQMFLPMKVS